MSKDTEIRDSDYIDLLKRSVAEERINYYEYYFKNIQKIEENIFRGTWKNTDQFYVLKLFDNQKSTQKFVNEIKSYRKVVLHPNILKFYGVTNIQADGLNNYSLVLEHADSGTLKTYLSDHFSELNWNDKYRLAFQLASALECLHECGIIHCILNAKNILVHQKNIKLVDFGILKNTDDESNDLLKLSVYIDPKRIDRQDYELNKKSDVYSIGILMWQISSGRQPFYNELVDHDLALQIINGKREEVVDGTPVEYSDLYQECWKHEPNERPDMQQVASTLKTIISHEKRDDDLSDINSSLNEKILGLNSEQGSNDGSSIRSSHVNESKSSQNRMTIESSKIDPEDNSTIIINIIIDKLIKKHNKGFTFEQVNQYINQQLSHSGQHSNDTINWLRKNQVKPQYVWFLGLFHYFNIDNNIENNSDIAVELFSKAASENFSIAQVYLAKCYNDGCGIKQNKNLSFQWYQKAAENKSIIGQVYLGYCYEYGIGIEQNGKESIYWYKKASDSGNMTAKLYLANCYRLGKGVERDETKAFKYYEILAAQNMSDAQYQLGNCFLDGIGTEKDKIRSKYWYEKAAKNGNIVANDMLRKHYNTQVNENNLQVLKKIKQFGYYYGTRLTKNNGVHYIQKSAESGNKIAQYKLGNFYIKGEDTRKDESKAFEFYKKSAEQGYIDAKFQLACCYDKGIGTDINKIKAFELYSIVAEEKNSDAQNCLGLLYENGQGIEKDFDKAFNCYKEAAKRKNKAAKYNLGRCYQFGIGVTKNEIKAFNLYREIADEGYVDAMFQLGNCYNKGIGAVINKSKAIESYEMAARKGNIDAQYNLGLLYENGEGIEKNLELALHWYQESAKNECTVAQYTLGAYYESGKGVDKDGNKAFELYERAANKEFVDAQYRLGKCYYNGIGTVIDKTKAFKLYKKASAKGNIEAQYDLGLLYENGEGTEKNLELALHWYQESANNVHGDAQYKLGNYNELRVRTDKDREKAFKLYEKAAKGGLIKAQYKLGNCYDNGIGTAIDKKKAFELYKNAVGKGYDEAQHSLGLLYEKGEGTEKNLELALNLYKKSEENKELQEKFKIINSDQLEKVEQLNDNISSAIMSTNNGKIKVAIKKLQIGEGRLHKINDWYHIYDHINIVEFLGIYIKDGNQLFVLMPFANGDNLRNYIKITTLSFGNKMEIAKNITNGIKFLHEKDIIHENLNPKNILVFDGIAKISNLPLSYNNNYKDGLYINGSLFDDIGYIDPNLLEKKNKSYKIDKSVDIYSLGILLWEIMSERIPYSKDQNLNIKQLGEAIKAIKDGHRENDIPGIPGEYIDLYKECWDGQSSNRPSINDVCDKLLNIKSHK